MISVMLLIAGYVQFGKNKMPLHALSLISFIKFIVLFGSRNVKLMFKYLETWS